MLKATNFPQHQSAIVVLLVALMSPGKMGVNMIEERKYTALSFVSSININTVQTGPEVAISCQLISYTLVKLAQSCDKSYLY